MDTRWTGQRAAALQQAERLSNVAFALKLGVAIRTVAKWHARPGLVLMPETQAILDTALSRATPEVQARFNEIVNAQQPVPMRVAIAIVLDDSGHVLMVRRRDSEQLRWQFPAGTVKPGQDPAVVAASECLAETGVTCHVASALGNRVHPVTGVLCDYFLADYVSGEPANLDQEENAEVRWMTFAQALDAVPAAQLYPAVEKLLQPPIALAVITRGDDVLLVRRRVQEGSLSWAFPGGKVEPGEAASHAAARETLEETGLIVKPVCVIGTRTHPVTGRRVTYVGCLVTGGQAEVRDRDELDRVTWTSAGHVGQYLPDIYPPVLSWLEPSQRGAQLTA